MGILIDSSVLIHLERTAKKTGTAPDLTLGVLAKTSGYVAAITVSELFHGVHRANTEQIRARREQFVLSCLDLFETLPFDRQTAEIHSRIWSDLQRSGRIIGSHDLLIAATALQHGLPVLTANSREFSRVENLRILGLTHLSSSVGGKPND